MPQAERVENLILGSGEAGKLLAWHLGKAGRRVVVVERKWIGGSCPNINCLPSKNEIWSARVAHTVRQAAAYGTVVDGARTDMARVLARKRKLVEEQVAFHRAMYKSSGNELVLGEGRFVGPKTLEVSQSGGGARLLAGDRVFLNLGTRAQVPSIPGLADVALTNIELLELGRLPDHLVVVGGGYVGLEFAQAYRRFGSRVTVVERGPKLLGREDPDVLAELHAMFADEGVDIVPNAQPLRVEGRRGSFRLHVRTSDGERAIEGSDLLAAMGRVPNTAGIGLGVAGVALDERGYIKVNERLEATAPEVWALGECAGSPQFTHASHDDFRIVRDNLAGGNRTTRGRLVPFTLFTDPPLARVGLNEIEARQRGIQPRVATLPANQVLRTFTTGEDRGLLKALIAPKRDDILGFTMLGAEAGEVMTVVHTAMLAGLPYTALREAVIAHPTMAEGLGPLFETVPSRP